MYLISHTITAADIEPVYNHVHHAHALTFIERARLAYLDHIGYSTDFLIGKGLYPVISSIQVNYLRELLAGVITISCEEPRIEHRALIIKQQIRNQRNKCCVVAEVTSMLFHKEIGRAVAPDPEFIKAFTGACLPPPAG
jgi:YbgC/YbaW family acyl-CoA thioester hydrolase